MLEIATIIVVFILMALGVLGAFIPILPSTPLIFVGALIYAFVTDFQAVTWKVLVALFVLAAASQGLDYLATVYGAKRMDASKWGMAGALAGTIIGLFFGGIAGVIAAPFIGAALFELLFARKALKASLKSGFGAFLGVIGGVLGKFLIALVMCGIFIWSLI
ncbi:MAG: DUF456 domain-containing protein [Deltaproteobacteria bacterium]|nr:DUF456 domain-containing protein [Deltaproteobacteria bacterium]